MAALGQGMDQVFAVVTEGSGLTQNNRDGPKSCIPTSQSLPSA